MEKYHMTKNKYIRQIRNEGLKPRNGEQSKCIGDSKKVVFYSQGEEGAVVMYLSFERMYEALKDERGDKLLEEYKDYLDGKIELSEDDLIKLKIQVEQIRAIRNTESFREYYEDGPYFSIQDIEEEIDDENFNFANSWTTKAILPEQLKVVSLRNIKNGEVTASKFDVIKYMMSIITPEMISNMGVNDILVDYIRNYYERNAEEIFRISNDYEIKMMSLEEYADMLENEHMEQGDISLSGKTIGQSILKEIKNTQEIEKVAHQMMNKQRSMERMESNIL